MALRVWDLVLDFRVPWFRLPGFRVPGFRVRELCMGREVRISEGKWGLGPQLRDTISTCTRMATVIQILRLKTHHPKPYTLNIADGADSA